MKISIFHLRKVAVYFAFSFFLLFALPITSFSQSSDIAWIPGPQTVELGDKIAEINLGEDYAFANSKDTIKIMELMGNPPSKKEVGMIIPDVENPPWFIVFEYNTVGYIKDDEKDEIDAEAILESIKRGTEEANKIRVKKGFDPLNVTGWHERPHYDAASHNLVWAIVADSKGKEIVNYNVRLLGRQGYMSATLVTDPSTLDTYKSEVENIIANFSYKRGKSYAEYVQGDKLAKYGLTALIAGGAGAAAAKTGLLKVLAKYIKVIVLGVIGFFAALWKKIKRLFGVREAPDVID